MEKDEEQSAGHGIISRHADLDTEVVSSESSDPEKAPDSDASTTEAAKVDYEYITGIKLWLCLTSIILVAFLTLLDTSIIVTAIPRITSDFHSLDDVGWYGSSYLLASSALQPLTGKMYSTFGSKYTFLTFLGIFELGSLLCGVAQYSSMLIIARAVAGLGASGLTNGCYTIMAAAVPMHKRPALMGIMMAVAQFGVVGGPLIGGALTQYASFYINLPIGGLCAVFLLVIKIPDRIKQSDGKKATVLSTLSSLDLLGFFLFAPFAIMFLLALEWGGSKFAWQSAMIIGLFCGAGGTLIVFGFWEYRAGDEAMFPYSMLRKTVMWSSCLVNGFIFGCILTSSYYLPIYFQAVKGVSPSLSGVYVLPGILGQMLMAVVSGVLVGKLGYYLPWMVTSGVVAAIGGGLISTFTPHTSTARWVGYQLLAGIGRGMGMAMPIVAIQNILTPEQIPIGMSLVAFFQTFGGALFLAFAQTIFSRSLVDGLKKFAPTVDAQTVITAGASAIRQVVKPEDIPGVLKAYNLGVNRNFYLAVGASAGTFLFSWGMGWSSVKKKKNVTPEA
ncbi:related to MFS multidrug transporter [Phialocephala subalpina]|uniref:Related to MFS multidrug transporter n=1 Tax=Phialocephala subalpina TaxID=576137 RepID=A0A1L7XKN2_9HELO|nr:related to MFS multidrug transporter [Phialocephala subalpina]